jgi:hypothetical protein
MGVKRSSDPLGERRWTQRYGFGWFRARGVEGPAWTTHQARPSVVNPAAGRSSFSR